MAGMNEGKLEFRFQLGSGVGLVETSQPLEVGQQYDIVILRYVTAICTAAHSFIPSNEMTRYCSIIIGRTIREGY